MTRVSVLSSCAVALSACCFQLPDPPRRDAGAACTEDGQCESSNCSRGFCTGLHCCREGRGGCSPDCEPGWQCSRCTRLFCTDHCEKVCATDEDCPATWQCVGTRCQVKPNPTRFLYPDGGYLVRRNATAEFAYEVENAEDGFLDAGMEFRDDSRPGQPHVFLPGQRGSYTFGPLDFAGGIQLIGWSQFGDPVSALVPFVVCREATENCAAEFPCCEGLACGDAGVCAP